MDLTNNSKLNALEYDAGVTIIGYNVESNKNEQDVAALKALIAEQRERGATVSEDIGNSDEYWWNDGRLMSINWSEKNLSGDLDISGVTSLTGLNCSKNQLSSLDVRNNTSLCRLHCDDNQLSNLDVSNNTSLTSLWCAGNQLTCLDVSNNTLLESLECSENQLSSSDVSKNTLLSQLMCSENQLTSLDLTNNTEMEYLYCDSDVTVTGHDPRVVSN